MNADSPLWTWRALCAALGVAAVDGPDVQGIDIDSRALQQGDLFVAVRAERDGHAFVADARAAGAVGALVATTDDYGLPVLQVADTLEGLQALARAGRARTAARVVAVTGSSGKTTFKTLLAAALDAHASAASFNNHLGVPLTLARLPAAARHAVIEIGTNHPGEITPLSELARPHVAVLLNVLPAHIGNFASLAALREEKLSIVAGLEPAGVFVMPVDLREHYSGSARVLTFGSAPAADVRLSVVDMAAETTATVRAAGQEARFVVPGGGEHRALSCTAACAAALALDPGADLAAFVAKLAASGVPTGRGNRLTVAGITLIDDSYNANPVSVAHALRELARTPTAGRRLALLGDILELGDQETALHAALADDCVGIDRVHCVGPRMRALYDRLPAQNCGEAILEPAECTPERVASWLQPGDSLLVKGSNLIFWKRDLVSRLATLLAARSQ